MERQNADRQNGNAEFLSKQALNFYAINGINMTSRHNDKTVNQNIDNDNDSAKTLYSPVLIFTKIEDKLKLPERPGVYVIREHNKFYCGKSMNIRKRVPESKREQRFGKSVYFFDSSLLTLQKNLTMEDFISILEANCISALQTIIWGNGLPCVVTNVRELEIIPKYISIKNCSENFNLAIEIAQSILYHFGFPKCMLEIPFYELLEAGLPSFISTYYQNTWGEVLEAERQQRRKSKYNESPLLIMSRR